MTTRDAASKRSPGTAYAEELLERARRVVTQEYPLGSVRAVRHEDGCYPHFGDRGDGARFWDAAGREYLDWFVGGGALTLGHRHRAVERAIEQQLRKGINSSLPSPLEVEVAEQLCALLPGAEMVGFGKNGTDATSAAVKIARAATGRDVVLISGYHGFADWSKAALEDCTGFPAALRSTVFEFGYNDLDGATRLMKEHATDVAAIVVEPLRYADVRLEFLQGLRSLADEYGAVLVFDEVLTGLRVARGGVAEFMSVRPDLSCVSKSLANGLPLSAVLGPRSLLRQIPATHFGMTFHRDTLSLAAARATLQVHFTEDVAGHLAHIGESLRERFTESAARHGLDWSLDGHPAMLHMHLEGAGRLTTKGAETLFLEECQRRGVYFQLHRVLPSYAHTEADVDQTATVMAAAMANVSRAMQEGLERYLDTAVSDDLQQPAPLVSEERPPVDWQDDGPFPFEVAPEAVRARGLARVRDPAAADTAVDANPNGVTLRIHSCDRTVPARCAVDTLEPVLPDVEIRARYRFLEWQPGNALASVILVASSLDYSLWCCARHDTTWGHPAWSRASFGDRHAQQICAYGATEGELMLRLAGEVMTAVHDVGQPIEIGSAPVARQPLRISFQLEARGACGPVTVELLDLSIRAL